MTCSFTFKNIPVLLLLFCFILLCTQQPAHAQRSGGLSTEHLAGFAFFKFAGVEPDFHSWVTLSHEYKMAMPRDRVFMIHNDVPRLENAFSNYDAGDHPIKIRTPVEVEVPSPAQVAKMLAQDGVITVKVIMPPEKESYFAVPVADMWIALIPQDIENLVSIEFSKEGFESFKKAAINNGLKGVKGKNKEALLNLELIPIQANTTSPMVVNNYELWMLMAAVTSFEIWSPDNKALVWYLDLPGYRPRAESGDVYNLFKQ